MSKEKDDNLKNNLKDSEDLEQSELEDTEKVEESEDESKNGKSSKDKEDNTVDINAKLIESIKKENESLSKEMEALKNKFVRTVAEYDNFRKRTSKEKADIYSDACKDVLKEVLPVLDNLERAVSSEGNAEDLKKGVEMTMKQFNLALEKLGVEEIDAKGEFNPHMHNAVMHVEDEKYGKNAIAEVFQKGYKRGEKVIRYSMVKVAN